MRRKRPTAIDLFCGAGGMALGFEQAGFDVVAALDVDPVHCAVHKYNFPNCMVLCTDIEKITGVDIREKLRETADIDVVFGGPPCQGFSAMGKRSTSDPRNELAWHFMRLVRQLNPKYFVFENVPGLRANNEVMLRRIVTYARRYGYEVQEPIQILNAARFGVPQDRNRLFLLGSRKGLPTPKYPEPRVIARPINGRFDEVDDGYCPSVWDAIGDLPEVDDFPNLFDVDKIKFKPKKTSTYVQFINASDLHFGYEREYDTRILTGCTRTRHNRQVMTRFAKTPQGQEEPLSRLFKLHPAGISRTLRAGTGSDRGSFTSPRPIHPYTPRCITVREAARLHSFPDWFRLHVTRWHGLRQIGNAVPPLLARALAAQLIKALEISPSKPSVVLVPEQEALVLANATQAVGLLCP